MLHALVAVTIEPTMYDSLTINVDDQPAGMDAARIRQRRKWPWLLLLLLSPLALAAQTPPDTLIQRVKACTACHGEHGEGGKDGFNPRIAGKPALYLYRQLLGFRDGQRNYPLMRHMVRPLSNDYLREIAKYFASLNPPHKPAQTVPLIQSLLSRGERVVRHGDPEHGVPACQSCHGDKLTGVLPGVPALLGLPYDYISAQLGAWRTHTRAATAPDCMAIVASRLSAQDITAVAGWLSAQPLPTDARAQQSAKNAPPLACGSSVQ